MQMDAWDGDGPCRHLYPICPVKQRVWALPVRTPMSTTRLTTLPLTSQHMECDYCGDSLSLDHHCSKCDMRVCTSCRLPENHDCQGLAIEKLEQQAKRERGEAVLFNNPEQTTQEDEGEVPDAIEDPETMGTRSNPDFDSSPDVSVDGSIQRDHDENNGRREEHGKSGGRTPFSTRQMLLVATLILIGVGGVLLQSGVVSL